MSKAALAILQGGLAGLGLPFGWLTEYMVRKAAHFTEYLILGLVAMQALRPHLVTEGLGVGAAASRPAGSGRHAVLVRALITAAVLVAVPSVDEGIVQHWLTQGRSALATDVLIDCSGAATGVLLTLAAHAIRRARARRRGPQAQ